MKAVIAIDSYKGCLSSLKAGNVVKKAFESVFDGYADVYPVADGGEGLAETLVKSLDGTIKEVNVTGPLGNEIKSYYGIINNGKTAVIEMAAASGITLVPDKLRNPMNTTTFGVGELIKYALDIGIRDFVIGIGGSATNDGGIGMLNSLGVKFFDENNNRCGIFGRDLADIKNIDIDGIDRRLSECSIKVACDVNNPLCGKNGASAVFGPQKGADKEMVDFLDKALLNYAEITEKLLGKEYKNNEGCGAAGGLGFALISYLNAKLLPGIDLVIEYIGIKEKIKECDIVITGEGRIDFQTVMGKAPGGIAKAAKEYGKTVIAFCGSKGENAQNCNNYGIDAVFPIIPSIITLDEAMDENTAETNLYDAAIQAFNLIKAVKEQFGSV